MDNLPLLNLSDTMGSIGDKVIAGDTKYLIAREENHIVLLQQAFVCRIQMEGLFPAGDNNSCPASGGFFNCFKYSFIDGDIFGIDKYKIYGIKSTL
jgi:hypothetical protein